MPNKEKEALLSAESVDAVLEFSQALWAAEHGVYSPFLSHELLIGLNNNAIPVDEKKLNEALANYKTSGQDLASMSEFMERWDMIYERTIDAYVNTLSFDLSYYCTNAFEWEYGSEEYKKDKRKIFEFLNGFDAVSQFKRVTKELMRKETHFTWLRETKPYGKPKKYALQIMPQNRCITEGYIDDGSPLYSIDMTYFLTPGVDLDSYAPAIKKMYNKAFGDSNKIDYRPSAPLTRRDGIYAMYVQCNPLDGAYCFKRDLSNFTNTPYLAPFMRNTLRNSLIGDLQYNKDIAAAYAILAGEIKLFDTAKSGTKADQFAISPKTLAGFMVKVKDGLPQQYKAVAMPTENIKSFQYKDENPNMFSTQLSDSAGVGSSMSRVVYSSDRQSNAELEAAIINDYNTMKPLYSQFANFLEYYANKECKKYHFKFIFDGCSQPFERQKRFDNLMKLADKGLILNASAYASVYGIQPQAFEAMLDEGKYGDLQSKLSMLLNANTTKDGGPGGRPTMDSSNLTDSGEDSQMYN